MIDDEPGGDNAPCECGSLSLMLLGRKRRRAVLDVCRERDAQIAKWGNQTHDVYKFLAILGEEVGEANNAALEIDCGGLTVAHLRAELVQVAAVAVQIIERIDTKELLA